MAVATSDPSRLDGVRVVFFDFMGTCLDWHSNIVRSFPQRLDQNVRSDLAIVWREAFFNDIHYRFDHHLPPEDIDLTHARLLKALLEDQEFHDVNLNDAEQDKAVRAWHQMTPWPDVASALGGLKGKYEIFVLANGTTRLQLDLARSSGLSFDMLFSSQLLGVTKPDPKMYGKAMDLVRVDPEQALMVAAHAYDLRAARDLGMKTAYIRRWSEDTKEDMELVQRAVDVFLGGMEPDSERTGKEDGKLTDLVEILKEVARSRCDRWYMPWESRLDSGSRPT